MGIRSMKNLALLLQPDSDLKMEIQVNWAIQLAVTWKKDILILQRVQSTENGVVEIPLDKPPGREATSAALKMMHIVRESPLLQPGPRENTEVSHVRKENMLHVRFIQFHYSNMTSLRRLLLAEIARNNVGLFTIVFKEYLDMKDPDLVRERRLLFRYLPCRSIFLQCPKKGKELSRILVLAEDGPDGKAALQIAGDLSSTVNGSLTALHVNPDIGPLSEQVGERRLNRLINKSLSKEQQQTLNRRIVVDDKVYRATLRVWAEGEHDLVVIGTPRNLIERGVASKLGKGITCATVNAASPVVSTFRKFVEEQIKRFIPQVEREDRIALMDRLQSSSTLNFDFMALMVLSTIMAAIGLIQNSGAVVIGAMLVAPLMTPLLGLGLALVQGNPVLTRESLRSILLGLSVSLLGGFLVGLCHVNFHEPTREMLARDWPSLLDLFVASAAGLAAAYAYSRPSLIAALPGVAIAAALVPPIATSGLALSQANIPLASGALLLFGINMVTIVLASMTSLWLVGIRKIKRASRLTVITEKIILAAVLALGIYLSVNPRVHELTQEIPEDLTETVRTTLGDDYELDSLAIAYDELGVQLKLFVAGKTPATAELATKVRTAASKHYVQPVRVRLVTRIEIGADPEKPEAPDQKKDLNDRQTEGEEALKAGE